MLFLQIIQFATNGLPNFRVGWNKKKCVRFYRCFQPFCLRDKRVASLTRCVNSLS